MTAVFSCLQAGPHAAAFQNLNVSNGKDDSQEGVAPQNNPQAEQLLAADVSQSKASSAPALPAALESPDHELSPSAINSPSEDTSHPQPNANQPPAGPSDSPEPETVVDSQKAASQAQVDDSSSSRETTTEQSPSSGKQQADGATHEAPEGKGLAVKAARPKPLKPSTSMQLPAAAVPDAVRYRPAAAPAKQTSSGIATKC